MAVYFFSARVPQIVRAAAGAANLIAAVAACVSLLASPVHASCPLPPGDVTGDGSVSITDVQCTIVVVLWSLGPPAALPPCAVPGPESADIDCSGAVMVSDVQLAIQLTLAMPLSGSLDGDGDGLVDACESAGACGGGCLPNCNDKECGSDGCGGTCGKCPGIAPYCVFGLCAFTACGSGCEGLQCGCKAGQTCKGGACCAPSCAGKTCGPDGCGGTCGTCSGGLPCNPDGTCCVPSCDDKECGDDGCGGGCGKCPGIAPYCVFHLCALQPCPSGCEGQRCGCSAGEICYGGSCEPEVCGSWQTCEEVSASTGGIVSTADGDASVEIPPGALPQSTVVSIIELESGSVPDPQLMASRIYDFGPDGSSFSIPATIRIGIDPLTTPTGTKLAFLDGDTWVVVDGSTIDGSYISGDVSHFTPFAALVPGTIGSYNPNPSCIEVDRVDASKIVPPSGLRVGFRVLDCDGNAVRLLAAGDVLAINDQSGLPFNASSEGGSASPVATSKATELYSVLVLDMSNSIANNPNNPDALDDVMDGAQAFVDGVLGESSAEFTHQIAIIAFGSTALTAVEQGFTADKALLTAVLDSLRQQGGRGTTNLYGAYIQGINLVKSQGSPDAVVERFVVTLTDGTHEAGDEANLRAQALNAKHTSDVRTYGVGVQGDYDSCKLEELAGSGCREGSACVKDTPPPDTCYDFISVAETTDLTEAFEAIAQRALGIARSNYVIGVCTPVELGTPSLTVAVTLDGLTASGSASYSTAALTGILAGCDAQGIAEGPLFCTEDICELACEEMECGTDFGVSCGTCAPPPASGCGTSACVEGQCVYGVVADGTQCPADDNPCTADVCSAGQCVHANKPAGAACDDGMAHTKNDHCDGAGGCAGLPYACEAKACEVSSEPNGVGCTVVNELAGTPCDDGSECTMNDACQVSPLGVASCVGSPGGCNDGNACTVDSCVGGSACAHQPVAAGVACNDGNLSTKNDVCDGQGGCAGESYACTAGVCVASSTPNGSGCVVVPKPAGSPCSDGVACTLNDTCNGSQGGCYGQPFDVECSDGDPCTTDICHALSGCGYTFNTAPCTDGLPETKNDVCNGAGGCVGTPYTCTAGQCDASSVPNGVNCTVVPHPNGTACNDGQVCTGPDTCQSGLCKGTAYSCNDANVCTDDSCVGDGTCAYVPNTKPCSSDNNACTKDICAQGSCTHPLLPNGASCPSDAEKCTLEACQNGVCTSTPYNGGTATNCIGIKTLIHFQKQNMLGDWWPYTRIVYTKTFAEALHWYQVGKGLCPWSVPIWQSGTDVVVDGADSFCNETVGSQIYVCAGNNAGLCSQVVTVQVGPDEPCTAACMPCTGPCN